MKILQVTNFFKPSWEAGGPARFAYEISRELVESGHDVTVYATDGYRSRLNVETNKPVCVDGIKTYYFRNLSTFFSKKLVFPIPYYAPLVLKENIKSFDVIHIHEYRTLLGIIAHYYADRYNIPYVLQAHGSVLPFFEKQKLKKLFDIFFRNVLHDANKLIALTKSESEQYMAMSVDKSKICIIPNGINSSKYVELPEKGAFKKKYSIRDGENIILYLGRIHKIKGIDLLINSFSNLTEKLDNIKLVIVGPDDGFLTSLNKQIASLNISDKVLFTGPLYDMNKIEAYVDADVYVLPSHSEEFPTTVLEACLCETPVIVTSGCKISELIDNKVGYVVNFDEMQLCDAISGLLCNDELRSKFGINGRKLVNESFDWSIVCRKIEDLYENVLVPKDNST